MKYITGLAVIILSTVLSASEADLWWQPLFEQGMTHVYKKELKEAEKLFKSILDKDNDIAQAHYGMGMVYYSKNPAGRDALNEFRKTTQLDREYARAYYQMGMVYKHRPKRIIKARDYFEKAVIYDPTISDAWLEIGNANKLLDMPEQTLKLYNKAIRHNPDNQEIFQQFLEIALWMQDNENIIETINYLIEKNPDNPQYYLNLAHVHFAAGHYQLSLDQLLETQKKFPDYSTSMLDLLLARNYFNMQDDAKGLKHYWKAIENLQDSTTVIEVYKDLSYLLTDKEHDKLQNTRLQDLPIFYKRFWNVRDPNYATLENERIGEHYRRLSFAQKNYRRYMLSNRFNEVAYQDLHPFANYNIQGSKMLEAAGFPQAVINSERDLDDLGLIFIRHGFPDDQARSMDGMPNIISEEYISWRLKKQDEYDAAMRHIVGGISANSGEIARRLNESPDDEAQMAVGAPRVPRADLGESLYRKEYFDNLPMNLSWKYFKTDTRPEMIFHFKKYGGFLGWVIEAIPYAPAGREDLDPKYGQLSVVSFMDRPDIEQVKRMCVEFKNETLEDLKSALQTESSDYRYISKPLTIPYTFKSFKGENNQTDLELYYLLEGNQTVLDRSQSPPELHLKTFLGMYDRNWDPSVRIKKTEKVPVDVRPDAWKYNSAVRLDRTSIKPGSHVYELQFTDLLSHRTGVYRDTLQIVNYNTNQLLSSDVILSNPITVKTEYSKFTKNDITYTPHMFSAYPSNATIGIYFEIYNLILNNEFKTHFNVECSLKPAGPIENLKEQKLYGFFKSLLGKDGQTGTAFDYQGISRDESIYLNLAVGKQETGIYDLIINIKDLNSGQEYTKKVGITIEHPNYQASND